MNQDGEDEVTAQKSISYPIFHLCPTLRVRCRKKNPQREAAPIHLFPLRESTSETLGQAALDMASIPLKHGRGSPKGWQAVLRFP